MSANSTGNITIRIAVDGEIRAFLVESTGDAEITNMELSGFEDFFEGTLHINHLKGNTKRYELFDPIPVKRGQDFVVALKDISGSSNTVYFALEIRK